MPGLEQGALCVLCCRGEEATLMCQNPGAMGCEDTESYRPLIPALLSKGWLCQGCLEIPENNPRWVQGAAEAGLEFV
jgi:hypothetical protein